MACLEPLRRDRCHMLSTAPTPSFSSSSRLWRPLRTHHDQAAVQRPIFQGIRAEACRALSARTGEPTVTSRGVATNGAQLRPVAQRSYGRDTATRRSPHGGSKHDQHPGLLHLVSMTRLSASRLVLASFLALSSNRMSNADQSAVQPLIASRGERRVNTTVMNRGPTEPRLPKPAPVRAETLTVADAAEACAVSQETIRRRLRDGRLPNAVRDPHPYGQWKIPVTDLVAAGLRPLRADLGERRDLEHLRDLLAQTEAELARAQALAQARQEHIDALQANLEDLRAVLVRLDEARRTGAGLPADGGGTSR